MSARPYFRVSEPGGWVDKWRRAVGTSDLRAVLGNLEKIWDDQIEPNPRGVLSTECEHLANCVPCGYFLSYGYLFCALRSFSGTNFLAHFLCSNLFSSLPVELVWIVGGELLWFVE